MKQMEMHLAPDTDSCKKYRQRSCLPMVSLWRGGGLCSDVITAKLLPSAAVTALGQESIGEARSWIMGI
jgi:hypothetical protein